MEKNSHPSIKLWPKSERPRERLRDHGVEALTDAELIALLLRNGVRGKDAIGLARDLVVRFGGLRGMAAANWNNLRKVKGLGPAKIASLLAASEITRRQLKEELIGTNAVRDPQTVLAYLTSSLRDKKKEIFKVLFLNKANIVLAAKDLFQGTVDETVVHPREIIQAALDLHATGIILVHNHPSGRIEPSTEDIQMTQKIKLACEAVSVKVVDHIIVGDNQFFSFREHGL